MGNILDLLGKNNGSVLNKLNNPNKNTDELEEELEDVSTWSPAKKNGKTPYIDPTSKNWKIGDVDTGVNAEGVDGVTPSIDPTSKNWMIGTADSGIKAEGEKGEQGDSMNITESVETIAARDAITTWAVGESCYVEVVPGVDSGQLFFVKEINPVVWGEGIDYGVGPQGESTYEIAKRVDPTIGTEEEWLTYLEESSRIGNTANNTYKNTSGNTANNTYKNTSGNTGGNTSGNTANNTYKNTSGNTGGNTANNTYKNTSGNTANNTYKNTSGNTAGNAIIPFMQSTTPSASKEGELWVDTGNNNEWKRSSSSGTGSWESVKDTSLSDVINPVTRTLSYSHVAGSYYKLFTYPTGSGGSARFKITFGTSNIEVLINFRFTSFAIRVLSMAGVFTTFFESIVLDTTGGENALYLKMKISYPGTIIFLSKEYYEVTPAFLELHTGTPTSTQTHIFTTEDEVSSKEEAQNKVDTRISASEKTALDSAIVNLNAGKSPDGLRINSDLVRRFGYETKTRQDHGFECPDSDLGTDYDATRAGIFVRVKVPIMLKDIAFNYAHSKDDDVNFEIFKYSEDHSSLSSFLRYDTSNLDSANQHTKFMLSNTLFNDGEIGDIIEPGDYYFSLYSVNGDIVFGYSDGVESDRFVNNMFVSIYGDASGEIPTWAMSGSGVVNRAIHNLYFDVLNSSLELGHVSMEQNGSQKQFSEDELLEGAKYSVGYIAERFEREEFTKQVFGLTCPTGKADYNPSKSGMLVSVKAPIRLDDFKFNYDFVATTEAVFRVQKYNKSHTKLYNVFSYELDYLDLANHNSVCNFSDSIAYGEDLGIFLDIGDYYISLEGVSGKIEFANNRSAAPNRYVDAHIVAIHHNAQGEKPDWDTTWASTTSGTGAVFALGFAVLNSSLWIGNLDITSAVDGEYELEGASYSYMKAGKPTRIQVSSKLNYYVDLASV